ncbi:MAG: hypothetical protein Q4F53_07500 [Nesterenkonia sp.]|uniref:hypothetical protein n=1 Tax=Nesterenkonia marinintestina TaxID=2979865 RepID=UPI0021C24CC6|nr:hypothetical protein [Nesterenkonia sp. GX14115]MDO5493438.1 hypothetical protein [Nesterenkonia sp.]
MEDDRQTGGAPTGWWKERRQDLGYALLGIVFIGVGAWQLVDGEHVMGAMTGAFGATVTIGMISLMIGSDSLVSRLLMITAAGGFTATGALLVGVGLFSPEALGWRGGASAIVVGVVTLAFFGTLTVVVIIRELRQR